MKILRKDVIQQRNQRVYTKSERKIMENMNCPFLVQLHYAFQTKEKLFLVMDFMIGGILNVKSIDL
jgi:serum/glucocorticoid-regulated kinase 2